MRRALLASLTLAAAACGGTELLQGDAFLPDGALPIEPATDRSDAGACDGPCAPIDAAPPGRDGAAEAGAEPSNTCAEARSMGSVSGDTGSDVVTASGKCAEWLRVRVTEDSSGAIGSEMKLELTLVPAGHDFDLYAFLDPSRDVLACAAPFARSETNAEAEEKLSLRWGEGTVANGSDDGRDVNVLVASALGPCPPAASWTLRAAGNR